MHSGVSTEVGMTNDEKYGLWRSGALARAAGVSADTLRHYEKMGLLPPPERTPAGYRLYPPDTLARVQLIQSAVRVGFTLAELAEVLKQRRSGGAPCPKVAELAARHNRRSEPKNTGRTTATEEGRSALCGAKESQSHRSQ
jgi:DNA-binding transcriptional MerR regulator